MSDLENTPTQKAVLFCRTKFLWFHVAHRKCINFGTYLDDELYLIAPIVSVLLWEISFKTNIVLRTFLLNLS